MLDPLVEIALSCHGAYSFYRILRSAYLYLQCADRSSFSLIWDIDNVESLVSVYCLPKTADTRAQLSTHLDETHLIERTQADNPEAFSPLVEKYHPRIYAHITRRVKDTELAKDLTQETWLRAFRAINSFRGDSAFYSWLYRIAENVCTDHFRRQKYNTEPLHFIDENRITETDPCPSRDVERAELREHLQTALTALTPIH